MTAWIISVCGIALLTVLCDVVVPDGNTKKYVRTVIGIVLSFTMLSPIVRFFDSAPTGSLHYESDIVTQQQFLDGIADQNDLARVQKVKGVTESLGIESCSVALDANGYVRVSVRCDKSTLLELQTALSRIENKILIAWSNNSE